MATLIVTNTNDAGAGSLRQAVLDANASVGVADTIQFATGLAGQTITLTSGGLALTDDVTIIGDNTGDDKADITISGGWDGLSLSDPFVSKVIFFSSGSETDVVLKSLSLTKGYGGGRGSVVQANGGTLSIESSIIAGNGSDLGSVVQAIDSILTVTNSFIGNNTTGVFNGITAVGSSSVNFIDSIVGNSLGVEDTVALTLTNSTLLGRVGKGEATLTIVNSVVGYLSGVVTTADHSAFTSTPTITNDLGGNFFNISEFGLNINRPDSPLVNGGSKGAAPLGFDASGSPRINSGFVDIGATKSTFAPNTLVVTNLNASGTGSLAEAVAQANATSVPDLIVFQAGLSGNIALTTTLVLSSNVSIIGDSNGDGDADITLTDGGATGALVRLTNTGNAALISLNFANSIVAGGASAIANYGGSLALLYDSFSGNQVSGTSIAAPVNSGTIVNTGTLSIGQSAFTNNTVQGSAGIYSAVAGATGGNGFDGAGAIFNSGVLTLQADLFTTSTGAGGRGANGANGYFGGVGGDGGHGAGGILNLGIMGGSGNFGAGLAGIRGHYGYGGQGNASYNNGGSGSYGTSANTSLNIGAGTGSVNAVATGTMGANSTSSIVAGTKYFGLGGSDALTGGAGSQFYGGTGADTLTSSGGSKVFGGMGDDQLINTLAGLAGLGGFWDGGLGIDTLRIDGSTLSGGNVAINLSTNTNSFGATIRNFENLIGTNSVGFGDSLTGNGTANSLSGRAGDDVLSGMDGNDYLFGGDGLDTLDGGIGNDSADFSDKSVSVTVALNGASVVTSSIGGIAEDTLVNIESLIGGSGADKFTGDGLANALIGNGGADKLLGDGSVMPTETANQIYRLYLATLGRGPDDAGQAGWTAQRDAGMALNTIATGFVNSAEFQAKYGALNNTQFVTLLYNNVLHRAPDAGGLAGWVNVLNGGGSRESVVTGFSESSEFIRSSDTELHVGQVYRLYGATLDRQPDPAGFEGWIGALDNGGGLLDIAAGFVGSSEFQTKYGALNNTQFVTLLYNNVLDRAPDPAGLNGWVNALNGGASRTSVVLGFSESLEYIGTTKAPFNTFMQSVQPTWEDVLVGGSGNDDLGGGRGADTFAFNNLDNSADHVYGLEAWDTIEVTGFGFASKAAALANLTQVGANVVFSSQGDSITFHQTTLAEVSDTNWLLS